jgi:hypothetical protein
MVCRQTGFEQIRSRRTNHGRAGRLARLSILALILLSSLELGFIQQRNRSKDSGPVTRFGQRYLKEAELVAEVTVQQVYQMGLGVDVAKIRLDQVILNRLPRWLQKRSEHLVLATRDQFMVDTRLLLILKRFGREARLTTIHRLSQVDAHYKDKAYLIRAYIKIEALPQVVQKREALARLVVQNMGHTSEWVRLNSLFELEGMLEDGKWVFTTGDVAHLKSMEGEAKPATFKKSLLDARVKMAEQAVEGPPLLKKVGEKKTEETPPSEKGPDKTPPAEMHPDKMKEGLQSVEKCFS